MSPADGVADLEDLLVAKLDHAIADRAVQMIVVGVSVVVLVSSTVGEPQLAQESGLDQEAERAIDRRPADRVSRVVHVANQLIGVEMLVRIENLPDEYAPGLGQFFSANLEEFSKFRFGGLRDGNRCQVVGCAGICQASNPQTRRFIVLAADCEGQDQFDNRFLILSGFPPMIQRPASEPAVRPVSITGCQPRPTSGIFVAMTVRKRTLASRGRLAM